MSDNFYTVPYEVELIPADETALIPVQGNEQAKQIPAGTVIYRVSFDHKEGFTKSVVLPSTYADRWVRIEGVSGAMILGWHCTTCPLNAAEIAKKRITERANRLRKELTDLTNKFPYA